MHIKLIILGVALLGMAAIFGCNKPQNTIDSTKQTTLEKTEVSDIDVTSNVKTALSNDEKVKILEITVVTTKGDVRLTGYADNQGQLEYIDNLVRSIQGVHSVHDELTIKK